MMEANVFIAKLKADGSKDDHTNLDEAFVIYKDILMKLANKDRGTFSLNVLCILCRNLEKVASWRTQIDNKALLTLTIEAVRGTRTLFNGEKVKSLACIYHIHRYVARQNTPIPPELILKLSYMPFEEKLLKEYAKTYWNIIADRICYVEKLKRKININKLLSKINDDVVEVIKIYNSVQFCTTIITFLFKKLHFLYNDTCADELNNVLGRIFVEISKKEDLKCFKKLQNNEIFDVYVKLNDCLYVVAENSSRIKFRDSILTKAVQTCIALVGHCPDLLHCLQTFFLNGFCSLFGNDNSMFKETVLNNLPLSCETCEKLGYAKAVNSTYPYLGQFVRLYVEFICGDLSKLTMEEAQSILNLISFLLKKLEFSEQVLKCDNCSVKTGLHDALRLSFMTKDLVENIKDDVKFLAKYFSLVQQQYEIINKLRKKGCKNVEKCLRKLQSDIHNTAINLNKYNQFEISIQLFEIYLRNEIFYFNTDLEMKNVSRALYNKSICEMDSKDYENALSDAYLSLIFAYPEGLTTEKYMSLVMDIKAKVLKLKNDETGEVMKADDVQMMTVLDVAAVAVDDEKYGNLKPFFCNLKFSTLLNHEFEMYSKLWPSIVPIAGVWRTLQDLTEHDVPWLTAKDDELQSCLYEIILKTPTVARSIQNDVFADVVTQLLDHFAHIRPSSVEIKIFVAALLFMKTEHEFAKASEKYAWKVEQGMDFDQMQTYRTVVQEYQVCKSAVEGVRLWMDIIKDLHEVPKTDFVQNALHISQVGVQLLLYLYRTKEGLQLAYICCVLSQYLSERQTYIQNASAIVYHANRQTKELTDIMTIANKYCAELICDSKHLDAVLVYLCGCAIFYNRIKMITMSAKLIQIVQAKILSAYESDPEVNLDMSIGRLLEAQSKLQLLSAPGVLSTSVGAQRHLLTVSNSETTWTKRRLKALVLKFHITQTSIYSCLTANNLQCHRRARSSAAAGSVASALGAAMLLTATCNAYATDDCRIKLDNRLKYIIGIEPTVDQLINSQTEQKHKKNNSLREELEIMRENMNNRNPVSPTLKINAAKFKIPEFFNHKTNCDCASCEIPFSFVIACQIAYKEAAMYYRSLENDVANDYFVGALSCCKKAIEKVSEIEEKFEGFIEDCVKRNLFEEIKRVEAQILIEASFYELSNKNFKMADEYVVRVHEVIQELEVDGYLKNEILNLMSTAAVIRRDDRKVIKQNLDVELDNLKLSPNNNNDVREPPKTPEAKVKIPPKIDRIKVKDEEVPKTKRKVIKLNLEEGFEDTEKEDKKKNDRKKSEFRIPLPLVAKPALEDMTPVNKRRIPKVLVTQPSVEIETPKSKENVDFFTPSQTPSEQFFTPMSTLKTYTKKSLRQNVVKNLENEFSTPKSQKTSESTVNDSLVQKFENLALKSAKKALVDSKIDKTDDGASNFNISKENDEENRSRTKVKAKAKVETGSLKNLKDKRALKRATSPGKLVKEEKPVRASRLRQPTKFSDKQS